MKGFQECTKILTRDAESFKPSSNSIGLLSKLNQPSPIFNHKSWPLPPTGEKEENTLKTTRTSVFTQIQCCILLGISLFRPIFLWFLSFSSSYMGSAIFSCDQVGLVVRKYLNPCFHHPDSDQHFTVNFILYYFNVIWQNMGQNYFGVVN